MTEQIKNLFKHKIPFHLRDRIIRVRGIYLKEFSNYQTIVIKFPPAIGIKKAETYTTK